MPSGLWTREEEPERGRNEEGVTRRWKGGLGSKCILLEAALTEVGRGLMNPG
jgi:hypothetical protein